MNGEKKRVCTHHPEEDLRFYCLHCEVPICRDCKILSHDDHKAELVSDVAKGMKKRLLEKLNKVEEAISRLKENAEAKNEKMESKTKTDYGSGVLNEVTNTADKTKAEIDKLVEAIECEIKLYDEETGNETSQNKIAKLASYKESILQAIDSDFVAVTSFKQLMEDVGNSEEKQEGTPLTRTIVEENLLSEFKPFFEEIIDNVRKFDVEG